MKYRILEQTTSCIDNNDICLETRFYPQFKKGFFSKWQDYTSNNNGNGGYVPVTFFSFSNIEDAEKFLNERMTIDKAIGTKIHEFPKKELTLEQAAAQCRP